MITFHCPVEMVVSKVLCLEIDCVFISKITEFASENKSLPPPHRQEETAGWKEKPDVHLLELVKKEATEWQRCLCRHTRLTRGRCLMSTCSLKSTLVQTVERRNYRGDSRCCVREQGCKD